MKKTFDETQQDFAENTKPEGECFMRSTRGE